MANISTLKDDNDDIIYPQTKYNAVLDLNGESLPSDFTKIVEYDKNGALTTEQTLLDNYYSKTDMDNVPTENSNRPVKSSGIYNELIAREKITTLWTGTLNGGSSINLTVVDYKRLKVYVQFGNCNQNSFEIDLSKLPGGSNYTYNGSVLAPAYDDLRNSASTIAPYLCLCTVNSAKTIFTVNWLGYINSSFGFVNRSSSNEYYVYKIEGVE